MGAMAGAALLSLAACGSTPAAVSPATAQQAPALIVQSSADPSAPASLETSPAAAAPESAAPAASAPASVSASLKPGPAVAPTPDKIRLGPLTYIRQTLNNCGPAAIAEVLHFWGVEQTQEQARLALRPDNNSRGMWPYPVPAYVAKLGMSSLMGVNGNPTLVKALVANGFPVIIAQWVSATDHTGHYREIEGFDDARQVFVSTDSYLGPNHELSYAEFSQIWNGNQRFMVVYPPAKQPLLNAVLASVGWDKTAAYQADMAKQLERAKNPAAASPRPFRRGEAGLGQAWDQIQLGNLEAARAAIQQATSQGADPLMVGWLNQALTAAPAA